MFLAFLRAEGTASRKKQDSYLHGAIDNKHIDKQINKEIGDGRVVCREAASC